MAWEQALSTQGQVPEGDDSYGEQGKMENVGSLPVTNARCYLNKYTLKRVSTLPAPLLRSRGVYCCLLSLDWCVWVHE